MLYLVHFDRPFRHARHYLGYTFENGDDAHAAVAKRLDRHRRGHGSRLLRHVADAGIGFTVVRVWPGLGRDAERRLKRSGHGPRHCPVCNPRQAHHLYVEDIDERKLCR